MAKNVRSLKTSAKNTKQDTPWIVALVEACVLAVVVLYAGFVIHDLTQQLRSAQGAAAGNGGVVATSPAETFPGQAYFCERDLKTCKQELAEVASVEESVSLNYVLNEDVSLVRGEKVDGAKEIFWLVKEAKDGTPEGHVKKHVGSFEVAEGPGEMRAFSLEKLSNGLYKFVATADYTEAGSITVGFIDPKTLGFLTFSNTAERPNDLIVNTPDITEAIIAPHLSEENCATSSSAVVDRLDWNNEVLYTFRRPPTVKCFMNELAGEIMLSALPNMVSERSVARDLQSFVLSMPTGQKLRLQFKGANKPTVTVVP